MTANRERAVLASFLVGSLLAGGNAVAVRFSNRELAPVWGAALRFSLAAALLVAIMAILRLPVPRGRALVGAALFGALNFGGAFALTYYALVRVPAGLGQTMLALVPLATLLLAVLQRQERLRVPSILGTVLAIAGVAIMTRASLEESVPVLSLLAVLGGVLCFAEAAVLVRRFPPVHPVSMNAVGMTAGAALLVVASVVLGQPIVLPDRIATWVSLGYVVPVGSVVVFILYLVVLHAWSASRAAYAFVLIPFVTVAISAWLLDEPVGLGLALGGLLVLGGVYLGALRPSPAARPEDLSPARTPERGT